MKFRLSNIQIPIDFPGLVRRFLLSWLLGAAVEYALLPSAFRNLNSTEGLGQMSLLRIFVISLSLCAILSLLGKFYFTESIERWAMAVGFAILSVLALHASFTWAFLCACVLILLCLTVYAIRGWQKKPELKTENRPCAPWHLWVTMGLSVLFFLFVSVWSVCRVYSFRTPTYDFGLFSQMFYHMKESGLPLTTLERDGLLSHFAVHVSPIYYLMLPLYWLSPAPATLQILQALVMVSAVIPLWLLCKLHGLSGVQRVLLCGIFLLFPAFAGGASYDLHENCFLTTLILWLFYGIRKKQSPTVAVCAFLTLCVKEDAAVYVAVIGLWLFLKALLQGNRRSTRDLLTGFALLSASLIWFFLVTGYLKTQGDGVMAYRYNNFMYDSDSSLLSVVRSVILNPMKTVFECVDKEKLPYLTLTLLPLLGLPLLTRRYERYLLLIPYILVNLMSDYSYQHDVFFQYNFGSVAFLFYLCILNVADLKYVWTRLSVLVTSLILCAVCFAPVVVPKAMRYPQLVAEHGQTYTRIRQSLDLIPKDASVCASTFYTTYLSQRETVYDLRYASREHLLCSDYIVIDPTDTTSYKDFSPGNEEADFAALLSLLQSEGYTKIVTVEDTLLIFQK